MREKSMPKFWKNAWGIRFDTSISRSTSYAVKNGKLRELRAD